MIVPPRGLSCVASCSPRPDSRDHSPDTLFSETRTTTFHSIFNLLVIILGCFFFFKVTREFLNTNLDQASLNFVMDKTLILSF